MLSDNYRIHRDSNLSLARSIVFKSESTIRSLERFFNAIGQPDGDVPSQWKYYLNLAGEYHWSDTPMSVISSDTKEEIPFTKSVLQNHPLTKAEYRRGGTLRSQLVSKHPEQEGLIDRILDPIDMNTAINAEDFTILYYDKKLIARNETNLIPKLQFWLKQIASRWLNRDFEETDSLYAADFIAKIYIFMVKEIASIRLENARTPQVGQWHLWNYLGSYQGLNRYRGFLTLEQQLWLYRNIIYIRRNAGSEEVVGQLIEKFLSIAGLETRRYDMLKMETNLESSGVIDPRFNLAKYNATNIEIDEAKLITPRQILELTTTKAVNNESVLDMAELALEEGIHRTIDNTRNTNILEVSQAYDPLAQFTNNAQLRLDYWIYLALEDLYTGPIVIEVPVAGTVILSPLEALILMIYATAKAMGKEDSEICRYDKTLPDTDPDYEICGAIPKIRVTHVIPETYPVKSSIRGLMDEDYVHVDGALDMIFDGLVTLRPVSNLNELTQFCSDVGSQNWRLYRARFAGYDHYGWSMVESASRAMLRNNEYRLVTEGLTWSDWLVQMELDLSELTREEFQSLSINILATAAGVDEIGLGLPPSQKAMVAVADLLTSYGLIVLEGSAFGNIPKAGWSLPSISRVTHEEVFGYRIWTPGGFDRELEGGLLSSSHNYDLEGQVGELNVEIVPHDQFDLESTLAVEAGNSYVDNHGINSSSFNITNLEITIVDEE